MSADTKQFCVLPLYHVNAFGFSFLATLLAGGQLVLNRSFHAKSFWSTVDREEPQIVSVVPEIVRQLNENAGMEKPRPFLKYFVTAASALPIAYYKKFVARFQCRLLQGYGLSETVNFSLQTPEEFNEQDQEKLILSEPRPTAGTPVWGNEVAVMALDSERLVDERETGEIVIRGWNVMPGYLDNPEATREAFRGGWFHSGDLGYFVKDDEGRPFFFISGRLKEIVKRNSETICLDEIDDCVRSLEGCSESAAVGFPNAFTGEEIGLVVVANAGTPSRERLKVILSERLPRHKTPKVIVFQNSLPRTASLKVQRRFLVPLFEEQQNVRF